MDESLKFFQTCIYIGFKVLEVKKIMTNSKSYIL